MRTTDILRAWWQILAGRRPSLSIEITRECPLHCPGCYAYEPGHLGGAATLRQLHDFRGDDLVRGVIELVERLRPLHVSLVGGDPLVRYRELDRILPELTGRGVHVQLVTSAFRPLSPQWAGYPRLTVVVSIDGLEPEHNARRAPATYSRILQHIAGQHVTVHCTITGQMMKRHGYLEEFTAFWSACPDVRRLWFSLFTPQRGAEADEILTSRERQAAVAELLRLRRVYAKVDMREGLIKELAKPPQSPAECIFAQTTETISADLMTRITPCQFGGDPDCAQCGCIASMGLASIGNYRLAGLIPVGEIFRASARIGNAIGRHPEPAPLLRVLQ
ncbi:MAG: radical SAM protein [Acidobacteria bacterium]|nr:radical SAM protein [Acidobacteriota bacterium]